jgi:hypothetical protein
MNPSTRWIDFLCTPSGVDLRGWHGDRRGFFLASVLRIKAHDDATTGPSVVAINYDTGH